MLKYENLSCIKVTLDSRLGDARKMYEPWVLIHSTFDDEHEMTSLDNLTPSVIAHQLRSRS